jgi:hypothetical protein
MTTQDNALNQAKMQASSIADMVAALNVDYARLEELREERDNFESDEVGNLASDEVHKVVWAQTFPEDAEELAELEEAAGDCEDEDQARERIQEDALDVQVRSDWYSPGSEENKASKFCILLCTGGPAVRILGELDIYGSPVHAYIQYQDWGTPWTEAVGVIDRGTLLQYCQCFYFGE